MEKVKKFIGVGIKENIFAVLAVLVLMLALLPLYRLGLYAAPYYDDYGYANYVKHFMAEDGFSGLVRGIDYTVRVTWYSWQGTYSSIAFMSLMPAVFGEQFYFLGSFIIITTLVISVFSFSYYALRMIVGTGKSRAVIVASLVSLFIVEFIYTAHQGFYWYNGAVHYVFMYSLMLLMANCCIGLGFSKSLTGKIINAVFMAILAVLVAGANFVVALQGILILIFALVMLLVQKKKQGLFIVPSILIYLYGLRMNVAAPGNAARAAFYKGLSPFWSVLLSFKEALLHIPEFAGIVTVIFIVLIAPVLWNIMSTSKVNCKFPGLVSFFSFCFYATGFTPSLYAMGNAGLERTLNVVKISLQLLIVINEAYWMGWISEKIKNKGINRGEFKYSIAYYAACALLFMLSFALSDNQAGTYSSYGAYHYIHTGEAANYRNEYLSMLDAIDKADGGEVAVLPHMFRPWLLCGNNELSEDPEAEQNVMLANFYDIKSIKIIPFNIE